MLKQQEPSLTTELQYQFTKREQSIVRLILKGFSNTQIANSLGISENTVKNNISRIYAKANVTSRSEFILKTMREMPGSNC